MADYSQYGFDPSVVNYLQNQQRMSATDAGISYEYDPSTQTFKGQTMSGPVTKTMAQIQQEAQQNNQYSQSNMNQAGGSNAIANPYGAENLNNGAQGLSGMGAGEASGTMANGATPYTETMSPQQIATLRSALQGGNANQTTNTTTGSDPITSLYRSVLGRAPDAGGLQYWQQQLASGVPIESIKQQFQATPEYQQRLANPTNSSTQANTNPYGISTSNQYAGSTNPYIQASQQTSLGNLAGAQTATAANRVNQSTPYSNLQYTQTGTDAQGNPIWSANQSLTGPLAGAQSSLAQGVANQANQGFNPNTPSVGINPGETYSDAIMRRLQPQQAHAAEQQAASLANQGIMPGSDAYNNAMRTFQQGQNDQLTSAQVGGIGVGLQANQSAFNQQLQQANLPYQQLGAFQQATQPGYVNPYTQAATTGPDYTGSYATSQAAALAQQNANNAKTANTQSGLYSLGGAAILGGGLNTLGNAVGGAYNWLTSSGTTPGLGQTTNWLGQTVTDPTYGQGGSAINYASQAADPNNIMGP